MCKYACKCSSIFVQLRKCTGSVTFYKNILFKTLSDSSTGRGNKDLNMKVSHHTCPNKM